LPFKLEKKFGKKIGFLRKSPSFFLFLPKKPAERLEAQKAF